MKKGSVLIIDDNSDMRDLIEHQVARISRHNVIMADSGERGLEMAREKRPDLILPKGQMLPLHQETPSRDSQGAVQVKS